jgi:GDPmannose 4,6-dehydratase
MKSALITGITGQDGSYLAEFLLDKGYKVYGLVRRTSTPNYWRIKAIRSHENLKLIDGDLTDLRSIEQAVKQSSPDEVYNLGAQSFVGTSFKQPAATLAATGEGAANVFEACREFAPNARIYQASTSELFGNVTKGVIDETTPFQPRSPYAAAKAYAHYMAAHVHREGYNQFISCGILFNHESPRRGIEFVTRKITDAVARIKLGVQDRVELGNLASKRDWGFAGDYVRAMWMMLQQDTPGDYVAATGSAHSVEDFCNAAFLAADIEIKWDGQGRDRKAYSVTNDNIVVAVNPEFFRPAEVDVLCGSPKQAELDFGWKPEVSFEQLVSMMVEEDIKRVQNEIKISQ